jgi:hypothetical protein
MPRVGLGRHFGPPSPRPAQGRPCEALIRVDSAGAVSAQTRQPSRTSVTAHSPLGRRVGSPPCRSDRAPSGTVPASSGLRQVEDVRSGWHDRPASPSAMALASGWPPKSEGADEAFPRNQCSPYVLGNRRHLRFVAVSFHLGSRRGGFFTVAGFCRGRGLLDRGGLFHGRLRPGGSAAGELISMSKAPQLGCLDRGGAGFCRGWGSPVRSIPGDPPSSRRATGYGVKAISIPYITAEDACIPASSGQLQRILISSASEGLRPIRHGLMTAFELPAAARPGRACRRRAFTTCQAFEGARRCRFAPCRVPNRHEAVIRLRNLQVDRTVPDGVRPRGRRFSKSL